MYNKGRHIPRRLQKNDSVYQPGVVNLRVHVLQLNYSSSNNKKTLQKNNKTPQFRLNNTNNPDNQSNNSTCHFETNWLEGALLLAQEQTCKGKFPHFPQSEAHSWMPLCHSKHATPLVVVSITSSTKVQYLTRAWTDYLYFIYNGQTIHIKGISWQCNPLIFSNGSLLNSSIEKKHLRGQNYP